MKRRGVSIFTWLWIGWAVLFAVIEFYSITGRRRGDRSLRALTDHLRWLRDRLSWWTVALLGLPWLWLGFHIGTNSNWPVG